MRIAPLADVKARLSAYLDECGVEGPVVITRNGKAVAVLEAFHRPVAKVERLARFQFPQTDLRFAGIKLRPLPDPHVKFHPRDDAG